MTRPAPVSRPLLRTALAVLSWWLLVSVDGYIGIQASGVGCHADGWNCVGWAVLGGLAGAALGACGAMFAGVALRLRWWYAPAAAAFLFAGCGLSVAAHALAMFGISIYAAPCLAGLISIPVDPPARTRYVGPRPAPAAATRPRPASPAQVRTVGALVGGALILGTAVLLMLALSS